MPKTSPPNTAPTPSTPTRLGHTAASTVAAACRRRMNTLLDGERVWGSAHTSYARHGITRRRLVVFPPGINTSQRRRLRLWRGWPLWGAALWLLTEIVLGNHLGPVAALTISATSYLAIGITAFVHAGTPRRHVRTCTVLTMDGAPTLKSLTQRHRIVSLTGALTAADRALASGAITPADHEIIWNTVYHHLEA